MLSSTTLALATRAEHSGLRRPCAQKLRVSDSMPPPPRPRPHALLCLSPDQGELARGPAVLDRAVGAPARREPRGRSQAFDARLDLGHVARGGVGAARVQALVLRDRKSVV